MNRLPFSFSIILAAVLLGSLGSGAWTQTQPATSATKPLRYKFTISQETTYVLGPVNADGTINYVAAYNEIMGKGLKPEDNAAILFIRALGPEFSRDPNYGNKILKALGMEELPAKGDYFMPISKVADSNHTEVTVAKRREWQEKLEALLESAKQGPVLSKDHPELADWLKVNARSLDLIVQASRCRRFFVPWISNADPPQMGDGLMRFSPVHLAVAKALVARAMLKAGDGDFAGASADLMAVHRLARLVAGGTLMEWLMGRVCDSYASDGDAALARGRMPLTVEKALMHLHALESLSSFPSSTDTFETGERLVSLDWDMAIAREGLNDPYERLESLFPGLSSSPQQKKEGRVPDVDMDFDEFLKLDSQCVDRLSACMKLPTFARRKAALEELDRDCLPEVMDVRKECHDLLSYRKRLNLVIAKVGAADKKKVARAVQEILGSDGFVTWPKICEMTDQARMSFELGKVALALAAYKAVKGEYPETLEALIPGYLKAIPADLFTGKPLIFKRDGKACVVYSVGPNMKDDGGKKVDPFAVPPAGAAAGTQPAEESDDIEVRVE